MPPPSPTQNSSYKRTQNAPPSKPPTPPVFSSVSNRILFCFCSCVCRRYFWLVLFYVPHTLFRSASDDRSAPSFRHPFYPTTTHPPTPILFITNPNWPISYTYNTVDRSPTRSLSFSPSLSLSNSTAIPPPPHPHFVVAVCVVVVAFAANKTPFQRRLKQSTNQTKKNAHFQHNNTNKKEALTMTMSKWRTP